MLLWGQKIVKATQPYYSLYNIYYPGNILHVLSKVCIMYIVYLNLYILILIESPVDTKIVPGICV